MSSYSTSRAQRMPAPEPQNQGGGLSVSTLIAAAIASAVAATVVSRLWQPGTIMATAMTPVIVALVKEAVERPARRVSSIATRTAPRPIARAARTVAPPPPQAEAPPPPIAADPELTEMRVYGRARTPARRRWRLAVLTGLLGAVVCIAALTLPELVAGRSVVSGSHDTTIFGGHRKASSATKTKTQSTSTAKQKTSTEQQVQTDTQQDQTTSTGTTTTAPQQAAPQTQTQTTPTQTTPAPTQTAPAQTTTTPPATTP
jgi:hypothetical protein